MLHRVDREVELLNRCENRGKLKKMKQRVWKIIVRSITTFPNVEIMYRMLDHMPSFFSLSISIFLSRYYTPQVVPRFFKVDALTRDYIRGILHL